MVARGARSGRKTSGDLTLSQITKAIISAAGLGKRLRPITHVVPKEMFSVGLHPAIEWVSAEAVASGCTEIAVIISPGKRIIEKYLTTYCFDITNKASFSFLVQPQPLGMGHALSLAREFCAGQPCAVLLPDDLIEASRLPLQQMATVFAGSGDDEPVAHADRYGHLQLRPLNDRVFKIEAMLPRAAQRDRISALLRVGRYVLSPSVLNIAVTLCDDSRIGELDDSTILQYMLDRGEPVYAVHVEGKRYDI